MLALNHPPASIVIYLYFKMKMYDTASGDISRSSAFSFPKRIARGGNKLWKSEKKWNSCCENARYEINRSILTKKNHSEHSQVKSMLAGDQPSIVSFFIELDIHRLFCFVYQYCGLFQYYCVQTKVSWHWKRHFVTWKGLHNSWHWHVETILNKAQCNGILSIKTCCDH